MGKDLVCAQGRVKFSSRRLHRSQPFAKNAKGWAPHFIVDSKGGPPARNLIFSPRSDFRGKTAAQVRAVLVDRIEKHSGDPYTPQPLVFDYLFCRLGATPYERDCNLIIDLTVLKFSDVAKYHKKAWAASPLQYTDFGKITHIPTYTMHLTENLLQTMKNFLRLYAFAADIIVFSDAVLYF